MANHISWVCLFVSDREKNLKQKLTGKGIIKKIFVTDGTV
jgi:hypothetical protein